MVPWPKQEVFKAIQKNNTHKNKHKNQERTIGLNSRNEIGTEIGRSGHEILSFLIFL